MEHLVKAMQDPKTGIPVKTQKIFLTTIPNAFTGEDMIRWIITTLNLKEAGKCKKFFSKSLSNLTLYL